MLVLISNRRTIRLGWFCFCMEILCILGASRQTSHLCYPYCSCHEGSMTCQWSSNITMNRTNGNETVFVHEMKDVTCKPLTSTHPIDIHFVKSDIDFIPTCMFENTTVVNLIFLESKIKVIRCMEFFNKSIQTITFHKSEILSIQPYAFTNSNIENLFITQSRINRINENAFYRSSLKTMAFVEDTIQYMGSGLFSSNIRNILSTIILYRCDIVFIGCQDYFPASFTLSKNKMTCDTHLYWLLKHLHDSSDLAGNTCRRPQKKIGKSLAELDLNELCWPPHICNSCKPATKIRENVKCLHMAGNPEHHLSKKSQRNRSPRKSLNGLKQKLTFAISHFNKTAKLTQNNQTPTNFSTPVTTRMGNLYLNINSVNNSSPINHSHMNGRFGKVNLNEKAESSVPNHVPRNSEKGHSSMSTPKKFRRKHASNLKIKSLESNDLNVSKKQQLKQRITRPEVSLLNNNSISTNRETMVKLFVPNHTKNNVNHVIEELRPGRWQRLSRKYNRQIPSSISKPLFQSQNQPNIIQSVQNLWEKANETGGNGSQSDDKMSTVLLIQAMIVLKKVYHAMPMDMAKSERRKLEVVEWVWQRVQANKRINKKWPSNKAKKLKSRNFESLQRWLTNFQPRKDAVADKVKSKVTATEMISKDDKMSVTVKQKIATT